MNSLKDRLGGAVRRVKSKSAMLGLHTALDYIEEGDGGEKSYGKGDRVSNALPEGVTSRMLYDDVLHIAWPSFAELMLTQLASMVDLMMVGRLGPWAISSVGLSTQPKFLLMTMFMSLNVGATAMVARYKGAGERSQANVILRQALLLTFIISVAASAVGYIFSEEMVRFMGAKAPEDLAGGTIYLQIQMAGFIFMALTSTITACLRGIGNSRTAMIYNLTANVVNVIFNYLLIEGHFGFPRMEVAGASLATVIGQLVAFVLAVMAITNGGNYLHLTRKDSYKPDKHALINIFNIGIPAMVEQFFMRIGIIIYTRTVADLGTVAYATHQVCMNIHSLSFMNGQAFAVSATSLTGQSLGKKRPDMAQAYTRRTRRVGSLIAVCIGIAFALFGRQIVSLYSDDAQIIAQGASILLFVAVMQPIQSSQFILAGALRGAGDTRATAVIMFVTTLVVRPVLAIVTVNLLNWGLSGAWIALVADQALRSFLVLIRYNSGKWKQIEIK